MVKPVFLRVDIETIPSQDTAVRFEFHEKHVGAVATPPDLDAIVADSRLTNPAKIEADIAKKRQKAASDHMAALEKADAAAEVEWRKTSLDAASGHVACVSWASDEEAVDNLHNDALKPFLQDDRHLSPSVTIHGRPGTSCACMYVLLIRHELKIDLAAQAFARVFPLYTCKQFGFEVPTDVGDVPALSPTYATVNDGAWAKLKEKAQFKVETPNLAEVIATIRDQIQPILDTVHTPRLGAAA